MDLYGLEINENSLYLNENYIWPLMYDLNKCASNNQSEDEFQKILLGAKRHAHVQVDKDAPSVSASTGNWALKCFHYLRGQAVGFYEGTTGLYAGPAYSDTESFGREIGRTKAKLLGLGLSTASPFVTGVGQICLQVEIL